MTCCLGDVHIEYTIKTYLDIFLWQKMTTHKKCIWKSHKKRDLLLKTTHFKACAHLINSLRRLAENNTHKHQLMHWPLLTIFLPLVSDSNLNCLH